MSQIPDEQEQAVYIRGHAMRKAKVRYGVRLSEWQYHLLCEQIRQGQSKPGQQQGMDRRIHLVKHEDTEMRVVWDQWWGLIVTFLPRYYQPKVEEMVSMDRLEVEE